MSGKAVAVILGLGILGSLPVWSCGLRKRLTFYEFAIAHTVFGPDPEYIPAELYTQPLTDEEFECLCVLREAEEILGTGQAVTAPCPQCGAEIRLRLPLPREVHCPSCMAVLEPVIGK